MAAQELKRKQLQEQTRSVRSPVFREDIPERDPQLQAWWDDLYTSPDFRRTFRSIAETKLARSLNDSEQQLIGRFLGSIDPATIRHMDIDAIIQSLSKRYVAGIAKMDERRGLDMQQILRHALTSSGREVDPERLNYNERGLPRDPYHREPLEYATLADTKHVEARFEFDSKYRDQSDFSSMNQFAWSVLMDSPQQKGKITVSGAAIRNVIGFSIGEFRIPVPSTTPSFDRKRYKLAIDEFKTQAFYNASARPFHYLFKTTTDGSFIDLSHIAANSTDDTFMLHTPLREWSKMTVQFYNPDALVTFKQDRFYATISAYGATTTIQTNENHGLTTADFVSMSGFTTLNPSNYSGELDIFNSDTPVAVATVPTATTFTVAIDTSGISGGDRIANMKFQVYVETRRFCIPVRLLYVPYDADNDPRT